MQLITLDSVIIFSMAKRKYVFTKSLKIVKNYLTNKIWSYKKI